MNDWVSCIRSDTIPGLSVLKPLVFTTLIECHLANSGWSIKAHQMTRWKPTQGRPQSSQVQNSRLRNRPQAALSRSCPRLCLHHLPIIPSGPLFLHGMEPIRYTHFPKMFGQPSGLDSQALSQPLGMGTRRAGRASWRQTPLILRRKECCLSLRGKCCYLTFPPSLGSRKTQMW